jgi:hypothetical protein
MADTIATPFAPIIVTIPTMSPASRVQVGELHLRIDEERPNDPYPQLIGSTWSRASAPPAFIGIAPLSRQS